MAETFVQLSNSLGVPVTFLLMIAYAIWQTAKWCGPRADDMLRRHFAFMDAVIATQIKLQETIEEHGTEFRAWRNSIDQKLQEMVGVKG